ncbi:MAG: T9SS type A sorting domain-containing protein [Ignavibacteria bacterium]|jgi:agmatine/peptidylarginine deiminase|nr:T9SS type A sorting domain-containing protein [Ignavibacteria bacterium]
MKLSKLIPTILITGILAIASLPAQQLLEKKQISPEKQKYYQQLLQEEKAKGELQSFKMQRVQPIKELKKDEVQEFIKALNSRKRHKMTPNLINLPVKEESEKKNAILQEELKTLPEKIRFVAEFEESQAVLVSIPSVPLYYLEEYNGVEYNILIPLLASSQALAVFGVEPGKGLGIFYPVMLGLSNDDEEAYVVPIYTWAVEFELYKDPETGKTDDNVAYIWTNLINAIQKECTAWIRISNLRDSTVVKEYMAAKGMELTNYKFFTDINGEDAFWVRDWGPLGFYYGDEQKLAFVDAHYYPGRAFDDEFPKVLLAEQGYDHYNLPVQMEGGNIMNDGYKYGTYSDVIYGNNTGNEGQIYYDKEMKQWFQKPFTPLTKAQLDAKMKEAFGFEDVIVPKHLISDGGTGHIDLWIKQFDEETMLIANMPEKYSSLTDYKIIQKNRAMIAAKETAFGTKYRFLNAPMPRLDNGSDMPVNDSLYNNDPRGYLNGVIVNKSYIYPTFSRKGEQNYKHDSTNNEILKELLPGYNLVPIDSRYLTPGGGALHCITMQIPADKAITIRHKPIRGFVPFSNTFELEAKLISNIDADNLVLRWKTHDMKSFREQAMEFDEENNKYIGKIEDTYLITEDDKIEYYIAACKGDEVRKCHPITAPNGYHTFFFKNSSVDQLYGFEPKKSEIASIYPNPVINRYLNIIIENENPGNISLEIYDILGNLVMTPIKEKYFNSGVFTVDIKDIKLIPGNYLIKMKSPKGISMSSFIVE